MPNTIISTLGLLTHGRSATGSRAYLGLAVLALFATASCVKGEGRPASTSRSPSALLWVPPNATVDVVPRSLKDGSGELRFRIRDAHANQLTQQLTRHFEHTEWRPRSTQHLNGHPTSFTEGWQSFAGLGVLQFDEKGRRATQLRYWVGEWENDREELIGYHLQETGYENASGHDVTGYATYSPRR